VFARGDRRLADVVEGAYRRGARFDAWDDCFVEGRWTEAFAEAGLDPAAYLGALPVEGRLPWDHLHIGVTTDFLLKEWHRYHAGRIGQACGVEGDPERPCFRCGLPCQATPPPRAARAAPSTPAWTPPVAAPAAPPEPVTEPRRLRVFFAKTGPSAYLSHLDLVRHLPRILRRAGLRPAYTQGFNPKPRLQFGPPLPLGVDALEEPCDLHVILAPEESDLALRDRLARASLPGLDILGVAWLPPEAPALARLCQVAEYRWELLRPEDREAVAARIPELLARTTWLKQSDPKGEPARDKDVRPSLVELRLEPGEPPAVVFAIAHRQEGSLRPRDLLLALVPDPDAAGHLVRVGWSRIEGEARVRLRP
jgi:radical SAM-linked protein